MAEKKKCQICKSWKENFSKFVCSDCVEEVQPDKLKKITQLISEGLQSDGAHHKQWYLEQIGILLKIDITRIPHEEGIC